MGAGSCVRGNHHDWVVWMRRGLLSVSHSSVCYCLPAEHLVKLFPFKAAPLRMEVTGQVGAPPPLPARVPTSVVHAPWLRFVGRTVHMSCVLSLQVLLAALENSVSQYPALEGRFCQVLGPVLAPLCAPVPLRAMWMSSARRAYCASPWRCPCKLASVACGTLGRWQG